MNRVANRVLSSKKMSSSFRSNSKLLNMYTLVVILFLLASPITLIIAQSDINATLTGSLIDNQDVSEKIILPDPVEVPEPELPETQEPETTEPIQEPFDPPELVEELPVEPPTQIPPEEPVTEEPVVDDPQAIEQPVGQPETPEIPEVDNITNTTVIEPINETPQNDTIDAPVENETNITIELPDNITESPEYPNQTNQTQNTTKPIEPDPKPIFSALDVRLVSADKITRGEIFQITSEVRNSGTGQTEDVVITWTMPHGFVIISGEPEYQCGIIEPEATCESTIGVLVSLDASLGDAEIKARVSYA